MRNISLILSTVFILIVSVSAQAAETVSAYQLNYKEQEAGIDPYPTQYIISDRFLRINDLDDEDDSGFVLYDDKTSTIYSVNHVDRRTLVMTKAASPALDLDKLVTSSYKLMPESPAISGHPVYRYRMNSKGQGDVLCADIQLAEGLLPQVTKVLQGYKALMSANLAATMHKTPAEFKTSCFIADQVYDAGDYYSKGLPIMEWHSNDSQKTLLDFKKVEVDPAIFVNPEGYRQFTME